jgi:predicted permease
LKYHFAGAIGSPVHKDGRHGGTAGFIFHRSSITVQRVGTSIKHISAALLYKLWLAPLLVLLLALLMQAKGTIAQITVFEVAMPTLLTSGIIAEQYYPQPAMANRVIGIGIVLSFITTVIWYYIITALL